jgi:serine/threonine protein kinase
LRFGIARLIGKARRTLTDAGAAIGSSHYMAPEQVAGEPVDARTDCWSHRAAGRAVLEVLDGTAVHRWSWNGGSLPYRRVR